MVGGAETFLVRSGKDREEIGEDEEHRNAQSIVARSAFGVCEEGMRGNGKRMRSEGVSRPLDV